MNRKLAVIPAVLAALLVATGTVYAAHRAGGAMMKGHIVGFVEDALTKNPLSAQQKTALEALVDKTMTQMKDGKAEHKAAMDQALTLFQADTLDTAALQKLHADRMERMSATLLPALSEAHDILSPAQRAELAQAIRDHHAQGGGHGFWGP
jgi:hypothetical protein